MCVSSEEVNLSPPENSSAPLHPSSLGSLFPLPYLHPTPRKPRSRSPRCRSRYLHQVRVYKWGCELVDTLNRWWKGMGGGAEVKAKSRVRSQRRTSSGQVSEVLARLRVAVRRAVRLAYPSGQETTVAESEGARFYGLDSLAGRGGVDPLIPLSVNNVAIPPVDHVKHDLSSLLPPEITSLLSSDVLKPGITDDLDVDSLTPAEWVAKGKGVFLGVPMGNMLRFYVNSLNMEL